MEVSGNSGGAALYAMQQSIKTSGMIDLVQKSAEGGQGTLAQTPPPPEPKESEVARMTGKGTNINTVA